jgi:peptide/nickel transport system substrate-binding protein
MYRPFRALLLIAALLVGPVTVRAESVLRVAMTAGDLPITIGQADQGYEGFRFVSYSLYDPLIAWDLGSAERPSGIVPGLATSWAVDPNDKTRWILKLRQGVKWHDGSTFTADDVVWNFGRLMDPKAPQFHAGQYADAKTRLPDYKAVEKIDDSTIAIITKQPNAMLPYQLAFLTMVSPTQYNKLGSWDAFARQPSGTGPYKLDKIVPRERLELVKNPDYWDPKRVPKHDRLVLYPMPEATTRAAALLSGQVDWIEAPSPDTIPKLREAGMNIVTNAYPHIWTYELSFRDNSPFKDIRVRKAANLAVDRAGLKELLGGMMIESVGNVPPDHPWYGNPSFNIKYDPDAARALLKEAGYDKDHPAHVKIAISTSGSGQMQPLQMNEFVQQNLNDVGFDVTFDVMDWNALIDVMRAGAGSPVALKNGDMGINFSRNTQDPFGAICRFIQSNQIGASGSNWGGFSDPEIDRVCDATTREFDPVKQSALFAQAHALMVDHAVMVWIAHDVNPRALSPKLHGFIQAKNWFQDLTPVTVGP